MTYATLPFGADYGRSREKSVVERKEEKSNHEEHEGSKVRTRVRTR
jgi:hypothetical protein